ncbi:hypothetical protein ACOSQ3_029622 [Xanthoceras sorbifolium]
MKLQKRKKQKRRKDIISRLPDDVLIHILSRLELLLLLEPAFNHQDGRISGN